MDARKKKRPRLSIGVKTDVEPANPRPVTSGWWTAACPTLDGASLGAQAAPQTSALGDPGLTPRTVYASTFGEALVTSPRDKGSSDPFKSSTTPACQYAVVHTRGSRRRIWEDRYCVSSTFLGDDNASVFAVFDGHGGCAAAEFAAQNIVNCLEQAWDKGNICEGVKRAFAQLDSLFLASVTSTSAGSSALERIAPDADDCAAPTAGHSVSRTSLPTRVVDHAGHVDHAERSAGTLLNTSADAPHRAVIENVRKKRPNPFARERCETGEVTIPGAEKCAGVQPGRLAPALSFSDVDGATALVLIALDGGQQLIFAHVGDSRAMAVQVVDGTVLHCTQDHTVVAMPEELERVRAAGGRIDNDGRVGGVLGITRSIGDAWLKLRPGSSGAVSAEPTVALLELAAPGGAMIVLATDGLWDGLSTKDAATLVYDSVKSPASLNTADATCEALQQSPLKADDIILSVQPPEGESALSIRTKTEPRVIAERLVAAARLRNVTDDITVLVVDLRWPRVVHRVTGDGQSHPLPVLCSTADAACDAERIHGPLSAPVLHTSAEDQGKMASGNLSELVPVASDVRLV